MRDVSCPHCAEQFADVHSSSANLVLLCRRHHVLWHLSRLRLDGLHVPWHPDARAAGPPGARERLTVSLS